MYNNKKKIPLGFIKKIDTRERLREKINKIFDFFFLFIIITIIVYRDTDLGVFGCKGEACKLVLRLRKIDLNG